jgi:hypothetical protein
LNYNNQYVKWFKIFKLHSWNLGHFLLNMNLIFQTNLKYWWPMEYSIYSPRIRLWFKYFPYINLNRHIVVVIKIFFDMLLLTMKDFHVRKIICFYTIRKIYHHFEEIISIQQLVLEYQFICQAVGWDCQGHMTPAHKWSSIEFGRKGVAIYHHGQVIMD